MASISVGGLVSKAGRYFKFKILRTGGSKNAGHGIDRKTYLVWFVKGYRGSILRVLNSWSHILFGV